MSTNRAPKVKPISPLSNAQRVPLDSMLEQLGKESRMTPAQRASKILELQIGPKTSAGR